jgi:hypothetical protein
MNKCHPYLQAHCQSPTSQRYKQSFVKELANANPISPQGFLSIAQKNKLNLYSVDRLVLIENEYF